MVHEKDRDLQLVEIKTRIPKSASEFIAELVARGYFSSVADFARQAILDKIINDFELGIAELEPDFLEQKHNEKNQTEEKKGGDTRA